MPPTTPMSPEFLLKALQKIQNTLNLSLIELESSKSIFIFAYGSSHFHSFEIDLPASKL